MYYLNITYIMGTAPWAWEHQNYRKETLRLHSGRPVQASKPTYFSYGLINDLLFLTLDLTIQTNSAI